MLEGVKQRSAALLAVYFVLCASVAFFLLLAGSELIAVSASAEMLHS